MKKPIFGLLLLFFLAYLIPLGGRSLVTPDEMRYGEIAREMNDSGDYIIPRINGLRYFEKPAGGHILNALSMRVFGETHFGVRFASAGMVGLAALALFLLVRREKDERTASLATLIYLTSVLVQGIGTFSTLDSMVSGFITLCLCFFYWAATVERWRCRLFALACMGVFAGYAFMVKGFLAFAVPVLVIVPFLLWQKQWKRLFTLPWIPILGILLVALPWCIAIGLREPDFWNYFFWEEHIHRFTAKGEAEHSAPLWFFVPVLLIGALPWTFLAPVALFRPVMTVVDKCRGYSRKEAQESQRPRVKSFRAFCASLWPLNRWSNNSHLNEPIIRFALIWLAMPFLFFSASSGKLPTYILPCFPPLAILMATGFLELLDQKRDRSIRAGMWVFFGITALAVVVLALSDVLPFEEAKIYQVGERGKLVIALIVLAISASLYFIALKKTARRFSLSMFGIATAVLMAGMQFAIPGSGSVSSGIEEFLVRNREHMPDNAIVVGCDRTTHAVCFMFKRDDIYVLKGMGELDYGLKYSDAEHRFLKTKEDFIRLMESRGDRPVVCIVRNNYLDDIRPEITEPVMEDHFRYLTFSVFPPLEN